MFSGQSEEQARRKILAVLLDETRKVLESARELTNVYKFVTEGKKKEIELSRVIKMLITIMINLSVVRWRSIKS